MSDVLSELRGLFEEAYWATQNRPGSALRWVDIERIFDAFAAAHPGLVDNTERCLVCGGPTYRLEYGAGMVCMGEHGAHPGKFVGVLCPTCAAEAQP